MTFDELEQPKDFVDPLNLWIVNGKRYDLTDFLDRHPGGRRNLAWTRGRDISELFLTYHSLSTMDFEPILEKYLAEDQSQIPTRHKLITSDFYPTLAKRVGEYFKSRNMSYKMPYSTLFLRFGIVLGLWSFTVARWLQGEWWTIVVMPVLYWWSGTFAMHEGAHFAATNNTSINYALCLLGSFTGATHTWFLQHNVGHHSYTNQVGHDPDLNWFKDRQPGFRLSEKQTWKKSFEWWGLGMSLHSITSVAAMSLLLQPENLINGKIQETVTIQNFWDSWDSVEFLIGRAIVFAVSTIPVWYMPGGKAFAFVVIPWLVQGAIFFLVTQASHLSEECFDAQPGTDWAIMQCSSAVDYQCESYITDFVMIGLNNQCIHHLFPQVASVHYPELEPIYDRTCKEFGVKRIVRSSWLEQFRAVIANIGRLNSTPDPSAPTSLKSGTKMD